MSTSNLTPEPPSTPDAVFAHLLKQLGEVGRAPSRTPASPLTPEALAAALFDVAASTGAALFSVWAAEDPREVSGDGDEAEAEEGGPATQVNAGISFFFNADASADRVGLLGSERVPVRQPMAQALYRPLGQALAAYAKRGADPRFPLRGGVSFPPGAADPDLEFRVTFRDDALGTWTTARARDREARQAFPSITSLPLSASAGTFLDAHFRQPAQALFRGQWVLLTGAAGTGRSTTLRALMDALPDNVHALAAVEEPKAGAGGAIGMVRVGQALPLAQAVRSFLRQDPDFIFADEVRTLEDVTILCNGALTGHGTACTLEAKSPEEGYAWLTEAMPGVPLMPLIVHHTRDAATGAFAMTLHETTPTDDGGAPRIVPWTPSV
ncbi:ATPase, T2SS/T4P/T4SS family [Pyxidicoccus sp. MSG2]|uniref:ATPase, T2SS/T4P/T4SS family n=1 Tax=Pyxidicoccus sp. MSG2 TaxID=2996790 RepID=UPI00226D8040|nr:ATPase, T2SS/T4P/T4SS family [Pyxidicoccus sp. MSG2]MCY1014562.1 ATPase, T2SS/T4P/T4SS family [Pyxidicoccus sp. MSG2]